METSRARGLCPKNGKGFHGNLQSMYSLHKYEYHHIWNADKSGAQVKKNGGARVLSSKGARQVHIQVLDKITFFFVLSCINANGASIPIFYISKGKKF